jgi:RHS repeat-associated protein
VDSGSTANYAYDHQNRRIKKVVGSTTTHYVWEGGQCIAEHNGATGAVLTDYIFAGSQMIARENGGNRIFFLNDRLGVRATITDGQGSIQGRQATLPFGEELNVSGTTDKHRFTSYERDTEMDTDNAVNRQYNQSVGRFNRVDPVSGSIGNPQSLNRYAYVQNDPINAVDPLGLNIEWTDCRIVAEFSFHPDFGWSVRFVEACPISGGESTVGQNRVNRAQCIDALNHYDEHRGNVLGTSLLFFSAQDRIIPASPILDEIFAEISTDSLNQDLVINNAREVFKDFLHHGHHIGELVNQAGLSREDVADLKGELTDAIEGLSLLQSEMNVIENTCGDVLRGEDQRRLQKAIKSAEWDNIVFRGLFKGILEIIGAPIA